MEIGNSMAVIGPTLTLLFALHMLLYALGEVGGRGGGGVCACLMNNCNCFVHLWMAVWCSG